MDVILSFDSEDYLTPEAADAEKWWADELTNRGIRGSFQCVGQLIRSLQQRGRDDVIQAMGRHEIGNHTDFHSYPPTHPQAVQDMSLSDGVQWVRDTEASSFATLRDAFGVAPISYCPPGDSWTPATLIAMAAAGVRTTASGRTDFPNGPNQPFWYCGLLICFYQMSFDRFFGEGAGQEEAFKSHYEEIAAALPENGVMIVYSHPTRLVASEFWDRVCFGGQAPPFDQLPPAPLWSAEHQATLKERCGRLVDWIQARPDTRFIDFTTLYERYREKGRTIESLLAECSLQAGEEHLLPVSRPVPPCALGAEAFEDLRYGWPVLPPDLKSDALFDQARELRWTSALAGRH